MEKLKEMLFMLMSQTLSLKEFETWLYEDDYIKSQLLKNKVIFELVSIDLRSGHAFYELEKFCFNYFNKEECLVQVMRYNSEMFLETRTEDAAEKFMRNVYRFHDWDTDYFLMSQVCFLSDDWELVDSGYMDGERLMNELSDIAEMFLKQLHSLNMEESIQLLRNGVEFRNN